MQQDPLVGDGDVEQFRHFFRIESVHVAKGDDDALFVGEPVEFASRHGEHLVGQHMPSAEIFGHHGFTAISAAAVTPTSAENVVTLKMS